jgi:hypothetical protein
MVISFNIKHQPFISYNNQQTIGLLTKESPDLKTKLRHVNIHHYWLCQEIRSKRLNVV